VSDFGEAGSRYRTVDISAWEGSYHHPTRSYDCLLSLPWVPVRAILTAILLNIYQRHVCSTYNHLGSVAPFPQYAIDVCTW
jgi:hypothetical protein